MKRILKKWLAMTLAVLMVMGTLPTTAWAARMETDEVVETPVLDKDDPVADTQGRQDEEERPEPDPDDPDPLPVDPAQLSWKVIDLDVDESTGAYTVTVEGDGGTKASNWSMAIVPLYVGTQSGTKGTLVTNITQINGSTNEETMSSNLLRTFLPSGAYHVTGGSTGTLNMPGESGTTGQLTVTGTMPTVATLTSLLNGTTDAEGNTYSGGAIKVAVLLATQDGVANLHKEYATTIGGGLSDTTWVVNLSDSTVRQQAADGTLLPDHASGGVSVDESGASVRVPLLNSSSTIYYVPFDAAVMEGQVDPQIVTPSDGAGHTVTTPPTFAQTNSTTTGVMSLSLKNKNPQTIVFDVPYYTELSSTATPVGHVTLTVKVVTNDLFADEVEFTISEDELTSTDPRKKEITIDFSDLEMSALYFITAEEEGESACNFTPNTYGLDMEWGAGNIDGVGSCVADGTDNAKVVFTPNTATATMTAGNSYYIMTDIFAYDVDLYDYMVYVPVKITVTPGEGETKYNYSFKLTYDENKPSGVTATVSEMPTPNPATHSILDSTATSESHEFTIPNTTPTLDGYTFKGWADNADGTGTTYAHDGTGKVTLNATSTATDATKTLYAIWEINKYTVTYEYHDGTTANTTETVAHGGTGTFPAYPSRTGWTANGWFAAATGGSSLGAAGDATPAITDNVTYHLQWTQNEYTLTWDGNDGAWGTDPTKTETKHYGESISAYTTDPDRADYKFLGWAATESGAVINFTTSPQTMPAAAKTYYAQWVGQSTVKFNLAGGTASSTGSVDERTGDVGTDIPDKPGNPTKTGYTFGGWSDGTTTVTDASGIKFPANAGDVVTYTAQWTEQPGSAAITVNKDGSGWTGRTVQLKLGSTTLNSTSNSGGTYNFTNVPSGTYTVIVNSVDTGVTVDVPKGDSVTGTVDFYTASVTGTHGSATVTGTANKTVGDASATAVSGATASIVALKGTAVTWTKGTADAHYHWGHWDSDTSATDDSVDLDSIAAATSHTATFEADTYTVTFDPYEGSTTAASVTVTYPNKVTSLPTASLANYTFTAGEWYTGNGKTSGNWGDKFTTSTAVTADITVYARYTYKIEYDLNSSKVTVGSITSSKPGDQSGYYDDGGQTAAAAATAQYFQFTGWNTKADGSGDDVAAGETGVTGNQKLYAQWTPKTAKITVQFSLDGTVDTWPTGYTSIDVTGPDGATWSAKSSDKTKVYTLNQGVNYTVTDGHYSQTITALAADTTVTIPYYTMTATTGGSGTVKVASGTLSETTTSAANNSVSIVVPYHASVTWTATPNANYTVTKWNSAADTATTKSESNVTAAVTKTVEFSKNKFNTYLKLNVNAQPWGTKGTSDTNIREVQLVTANNGNTNVSGVTVSYDGTEEVWAATGIASNTTNAQPYWRVTTVDGGIYYTAASVADKTADADVEDATATENLFGLVIEDGAGNGTGNKPTLKAQSGSTARNRIVTRAGNQNTVALNAKAGYTFADWAMEKGLAPAVADTTATDIGDGDSTKYTIANDYAALATAPENGDLDLHIMPIYTFSTTIETRHLTATSTLTNVTSVVVYEAGTTTTAINGVKQSANGTYLVSGLDPAKTYDIWVNGFKVGAGNKQVTSANANGKVPVVVFKVTTARDPSAGGTSSVVLTDAASATHEAIVPNGAKVTTDAPTVNAAATTATGYRKWSIANGDASAFWTASAGTVTTPQGDSTTWTIDSMTADVTLTAHYMAQYGATVSVAPTTGGTATFTDKGSNGTAIGSPATTATVDSGTWVEATYIPSVGNTLKGWTVTNGNLYSDSTLTPIANPATHTGTVVYFVPTADGAKLTANTESALYEVEIAVNLDNGAYEDSGTNKVQVKISDGTNTYDLTKKSDGVYTVKALPGDYDIYVNGLDISKTVAATAAFDTAKNLNFSANDAEGKDADGDPLTDAALAAAKAKLKQEINYYTVKLAVSPANASPVNNQVAFASSVANVPSTATGAASVIVLATASTQNISIAAKAYDDGATTHYRFDEWEITQPSGLGTLGHTPTQAAETYTLPNETTLKAKTSGNFNITSDKQITLTASFVQQFKVTVTRASASLPEPKIKVTVGGSWVSGDNKSVLVDENKTISVNMGPFSANYVFADWSVQSGSGEFDNTTHTVTAAQSKKDKGYLQPTDDNVFKPTADSTLVLNGWQKATLAAGWTYDTVEGTYSTVTGGAPGQELKWTKNNGGESPTAIKLEKCATADFTSGVTSVTLNAGDLTQDTTDKTKFTFKQAFLDGLNAAFYRVTFTYTLGGDTHPNKDTTPTTSAIFTIKATKKDLTEVNIQVSTDTTAATANPVAATNRNAVIYKDHTDAKIKTDELEYTWYYANVAPTQKHFNNETDPTAAAKAAAGAVSGSTPITGTSNTVTVTDAMKGKYIFAVVNVKAGGESGQGAVITNAIPVDYDATITVKKDTAAITADYGHYKVYLVPTTLTNPNFGGNLATQGIVEATHVAGTDAAGVFSTKNSGLVGETNYYVYVNDAENTTTHIMKADNTAITPLAHTKDVNYYSVNRVDFTQKHFEDSANVKVGEDFSTGTYAINSVTTGNNSSVADGYGVLSGVSVTAKANTWTQDYDLTWQKKAGNTIVTSGFAFATDGTDDTAEVQNSTNANGTGYANGAVTAKTFIGGRLDQNTYTITGDVKGSGQIASAVLTFKKNETTTYTFNGTVGGNGGNGAIVTFTVPRSNAPAGEITGAYTLKATAKSASPITTLKGYSVPSKSTATTTDDTVDLAELKAGTTGTATDGSKLNNRFTIFVEATELKITVKDDTSPTANTSTASNTATASTGNGDQWKKVFANYNATKGDKMTYDVTIQNNGNAELDVTLVLQKSTDGGSTWTDIYMTGATTLPGTASDTDTNDVQFTGLADKFSLAVGTSKIFKVTIPEDLDNDDDVTYRFKFDTADGRDGYDAPAPTGQYDLKLTIDPVTVSKVTTVHPGNDPTKYTVDKTRIKEDDAVSATDTHSYGKLHKPQDNPGNAPDTTNNDLVYEWYVANWNDTVTFNSTDGKLYNGSTAMTPLTAGVSADTLTFDLAANPAAQGKTLYLLAKGQNNATGAATTPDVINKVDPPMFLPFTGKIKVEEDDVVIATNGTGTGDDDYQVYLWDKSKGTFDPDNTTHMSQAITTTWVNPTALGAGDGHFKADNLPSASYNATTKTKKVYEYEVWASRVKGNATLQNTGLTITVDDQEKTVDYYKVQIDNTSVTQGIYDGKLTPATGSTIFLTAPTQTMPTAATKVGNITVADNGFVQKGNTVTFTYNDWVKDYLLTWGGAASGTADPGANATKDVTYSAVENDKVTTTLSLKTYNVTANVVGTMGKVEYFSMVLTDNGNTYTFTSKTGSPDGNAILGIAPSATDIAAGDNVVFRLPKAGPYVTKATMPASSAAKLVSYTNTDGTTTTVTTGNETINVTVPDRDVSYDATLQGEGMSMTIADNIPAATTIGGKNLETSGATAKSGNASITPQASGDPIIGHLDATQEIHLNYNRYTAAFPVELTFQNMSKHDADGNNDLQNVTFVKTGTTTQKPGGGDSITIDASSEVTGTGIEIETVADGTTPVTKKVVLNVQPGLTVGTYTFTGKASFQDAAAHTAETSYTLKVVIEPLPFTAVTIQESSGTLSIQDYTVQPKDEGGAAVAAITTSPNATESVADANTALIKNNDYNYQWVRADIGTTPTISWTAGALTVTDGEKISGATSKSYTPGTADQGKDIYLVIYAQNGKNASEAAISDPITSTFQGVVKISVDGTVQTTDPGTSGTPATPVYTVNFVNGGTKIAGAWNDAAQGYVAALDPTKTYTVEVSRAKGDKTHLVTLASVTIDNDHRTDTAPYFTVNAVALSAKEYQSGTGESFALGAGTSTTATNITPAFTIGADKAALADATPVLSGQTVAAKAPAMAAPNANKAWTQDYTLTWRQAANNGLTTATDANLADSTVTGQSNTAAIADGAYPYGAVTAKTFIGGRLDQKTYTVTGSINGSGTVKDVTLTGGTGSKVYGLGNVTGVTTPSKDITANNTWTDADNNTNQNQGDKYTFTVVKGTYTVTAYEGANTTIRKVTVDASSAAGTTRNTNSLADVETNARTFTIHLEDAGAKLGVKDSDPNNEAYHVSDSTTPNNRDEKVQTYFFSGIPAGNKVDLLLNNPGNVDLKLAAPAVYKVASGTDYTTNFDSFITTNLIPANAYTSGSSALTISNLPAAGTAVAIGAGVTGAGNPAAVAGGTLTVATNAANTADAIYVVKFASTYTDTEGTSHDGPTVYYVFDLTVDPLPIKTVVAEKLADGKLQLKDYAAGTADSGLANITVAYNAANATAAADTKELHDSDFSYIWAKAAPGVTVDASKFELTASGMAVKSGVTGVTVLTSGTGYNTRQFTPATTDQGYNFYLVAYRAADTANASEFAVSDALYANVTVTLLDYRTGTTTPVTGVDITGTYKGADTKSSSSPNTITTTAAGDTIALVADNADNATPASATYYFKEWAPTTMTAGADRYHKTLTVTAPTTVIGYYDLLPTLSGSNTYSVGAEAYDNRTNTTAEKAARTFTYNHNDGSGSNHVEIWIAPAAGKTFPDGTTAAIKLATTDFDQVADSAVTVSTVFGGDGAYSLKEAWIRSHLASSGSSPDNYVITFYDMTKGAKATGGYAGYDRSISFAITKGELNVKAEAEDMDSATPGIQGYGQVTVGTQGPADEATDRTTNGKVTIVATPKTGYKFTGWTYKDEDAPSKGTFGDQTAATTTFTPATDYECVVAHFEAADFEVTDARVDAVYGNKTLTVTTPFTATAEGSLTGLTYKYTVTGLPDWVTLADNGAITFTAGKTVNTNVETADATGATYTAKDELDLTVTVTETHSGKSKTAHLVINVDPGTLTVNHAAGQTTATDRGTAYSNANRAGSPNPFIPLGTNGNPKYGETVLKHLFAYTNVTDQATTVIDATGHAGDAANGDSGAYTNGTWTVSPTRFQGTDAASTYTFTFSYKPNSATEKWNYTAAKTDMTLTIAKPPVGAQFADTMSASDRPAATAFDVKPGTYSDFDDTTANKTTSGAPLTLNFVQDAKREGEHITYLDNEPKYLVKLKSLDAPIYGVKLTQDDLTGFTRNALPTFTNNQFANADGEKTFTLTLAALHDNVWAGTHHAKFTLTGYSSAEGAAEGGDPDITATYELTIVVDPKVVTDLVVKVTDPRTTPDSVTAKSDGTELPTTDPKGNKPIKDVDITWEPTTNKPDGKNTGVKVDVEIDPNYKYDPDIDTGDHTKLEVANKPTPKPTVTQDGTDPDHIVHITQGIPYLMHDDVKVGTPTDTTGPRVNDTRTVTVAPGTTADTLGSYTINLGAYGADVHNVTWTIEGDDTLTTAGATLTGLPAGTFDLTKDTKRTVTLDLTGFTGELTAGKRYSLSLKAAGKANATDAEANIISTYVFTLQVSTPSSPGGPVEPACPCKVFYHVGIHGTTADPTVEDVSENGTPAAPPTVTALEGYVFKGWSLTNPATLKEGEKAELVDPKTVKAKGETMIFYAVLQVYVRPFHQHYVIGYPNGTFGPADDINRASVATIIARAVLPGFVEGADYGNPGGYSDVEGHWAESAIAYCSKFGVFEGMPDGTFQPDRPITRQELAVAVARLDGILEPGEMSFTDIEEAGDWAMGGIYTAYTKGWVNGYPDGSFKPLNNIRRDEAVKLFNAYLNRGVDAEGLSDLKEYVHSGVASNNTENGENEYMTWPDVPKDQWAYYEIIEAANDHEYRVDDDGNYTVPEHWEKCWIDERWRYGDDPAGAAANAGAAVSAGFRVWFD